MPGNFWKFLGSAGVSSIGDGVRATALPLLAASYTEDPVLLGIVVGAGNLSWLLFALPLGALADRHERKRLMVISHLARGLIVGILSLTLGLSVRSIWIIVIANFVLGVFDVLFEVASQPALTAVVPTASLSKANSWLSTFTMLFDEFIGPLVGAVLFAIAVVLPFYVDFVSFLIAAALLVFIRLEFTPGAGRSPLARSSLRLEILEGAAWLRRSGVVMLNVATATSLNFVRAATLAVLVLYSLHTIEVGAVGFAILNMLLAAGALLGSATAALIVRRVSESMILLYVPYVIASCYLAMGLFPSGVVAGSGLAIIGFAMMNWMIVSNTVRQTLTPGNVLGRVTSVARFFAWGSMPVGAFLGGLLAQVAGYSAPFFWGGVIICASATVVHLAGWKRHAGLSSLLERARNQEQVETK